MSDPDAPCEVCGFSVETPVRRLSASTVGLFPDRRLPGRCVLVLDAHHEHFEALPAALASRFMADTQRVARAVRAVSGSTRIFTLSKSFLSCSGVASLLCFATIFTSRSIFLT